MAPPGWARARATCGPLRPVRRLGCLRGWGFSVRTGCVGGLDCVSCVSDGLCVGSFVSLVVLCVFHLLRFVCSLVSARALCWRRRRSCRKTVKKFDTQTHVHEAGDELPSGALDVDLFRELDSLESKLNLVLMHVSRIGTTGNGPGSLPPTPPRTGSMQVHRPSLYPSRHAMQPSSRAPPFSE